MKKLIIGLFLFGLTTQMFSQITKLPEVIVKSVNYKYLIAVDENVEDIDVKNIHYLRKIQPHLILKVLLLIYILLMVKT